MWIDITVRPGRTTSLIQFTVHETSLIHHICMGMSSIIVVTHRNRICVSMVTVTVIRTAFFCVVPSSNDPETDILLGALLGTCGAILVTLVCVSIAGLSCLVVCRGQHDTKPIAHTADGQPPRTGGDQSLFTTSEAILEVASNPERPGQNNRPTSVQSLDDLQDMGSGVSV